MKQFLAKALICLAFPALAFANAKVINNGGNIGNPPNILSPGSVGTAIYQGKGLLLMWMNQLELQSTHYNPDQRLLDFLFNNKPNVFDVIHPLKIVSPVSKPCYDKYGQEMDGSVIAHKPNRICISKYRLEAKLSDLDVDHQVIALILHEISHIMGADEKLAQELQQKAIGDLSRYTIKQAQKTAYGLRNFQFKPETQLLKIRNRGYGNYNGSCEEIENLHNLFQDAYDRRHDSEVRIRVFRNEQNDIYDQSRVRIWALMNFMCSQDPQVPAAKQKENQDKYDKGFGSSLLVTPDQYWHGRDSGFWNKIQIRKIQNETDFLAELDELKKLFKDARDTAVSLEMAVFPDVWENDP